MAIEDENTVDAVGIEPGTGHGMMVISDELDWSDPVRHMVLLQAKVTAYVGFLQSGQLGNALPEAVGRKAKIAIIQQYEPPEEAILVLSALGDALSRQGIEFGYGPLPESFALPA